LSTHIGFAFESKIFISQIDLPSGSDPVEETLLSISGFYGAIKCFKFLFLNGANITSNVCKTVVKGGKSEILHIIERKKPLFEESLGSAIEYYRNDVADWLLNHFKVGYFSLKECFCSMNYPAMFYLLSQGIEVNKTFICLSISMFVFPNSYSSSYFKVVILRFLQFIIAFFN
jgi:hypothetical protein